MTPQPVPRRVSPFALPNILTYGRIAAVPVVVACLFWPTDLWVRWIAFGAFAAAAITDYFDGYLARAWGQQSSLGRMLDPIADKLLVSACLLMLTADGTIRSWSLWAAIVILCREILVSGLREFLAELRVSVPVTWLAKWKTTAQLVAIGFLLVGPAGDALLAQGRVVTMVGLALLWISAVVTIYTGYDYFRAGVRHLIEIDGAMKILYFAWLRERIGVGSEDIELPPSVRTIGDLMAFLAGRGEEYAFAFENPKVVRAAIDQMHVKPSAAIEGAREIAFFPPMTGG